MKRKNYLALLLLVLCQVVMSQNIQFHYDFRHALNKDIPASNYLTTTVEMFKPDKWGSTFFFVDMDYNQSKQNIGLAYWEIARDFKIGKCPVMPHIEYNGGLINDKEYGISIPNSYLLGLSYPFSIGKAHFGTTLSYKYNSFSKVSHDIQLTNTWGVNLLDNKLTLSGFIDIWSENKDQKGLESGKKVILLTEPQVWYNVNEHLSLGSEVEISNKFYGIYSDKLYAFPTVAAKWNF